MLGIELFIPNVPSLRFKRRHAMPVMKRFKTDYVGVYYIIGTAIATGKSEKIFYITYRRDGQLIEEKAGRQFSDAMTAARASRIRAERIEGKSLPNKERREEKRRQNEKQEWTISRLWEEYIATKPKTKGYIVDNQRFKNHIEPILGDKKLEDLAPLDLDRLRLRLLKEKAPQTVKSSMSLLKRISNFARNKRLCKGIDFKIALPRVSNQKTEFLTEEQLKRLLDTIEKNQNPYAGPIMLTALFTGMRKGEILRLEWRDIDFEHGFIHIRGPKGGEDQRIPLNDATKGIFEKLPRTHDLLFPGQHGLRTGIYHAIGEIKKKAGLPKDFRPLHGLRHHYASMLASSGKVDMYVLQKLLTHKSPTMTQRYAHLRDEALKRASNLAGELVNQIIKEEKNVANSD
jgi:integrase